MIRRRRVSISALVALLVVVALYLVQRAPASRTAPATAPPVGETPRADARHRTAQQPSNAEPNAAPPPNSANDNALVARLFRERRSNVVVEVAAQVERTLRDDMQGSPHQRFVVRLSPDITLLVAHNTRLAPRVPLQPGSAVRIRGEYEWTAQGGVVHWTHRDPAHRHQDGWIDFEGRRYQ